jgi:hypothetical protein
LLLACCRARGKHKCFMRLTRKGGKASTSGEPAVSSPFAQNHDRQVRSPTEVAISLETQRFD